MKQIIPDSPQYARDIAQSVMLSLTATVHWFKIPQDDYAREAMHRRWAAAVNASGLTEEQIGAALQRYLQARKASDPVPEPGDIFKHVADGDQDEMQVGLRLFLDWIKRARENDWRAAAYAWGFAELMTWGAVLIPGVREDNRPGNLPEILEAMGFPAEAEINRYTYTEIISNQQLEQELEKRNK